MALFILGAGVLVSCGKSSEITIPQEVTIKKRWDNGNPSLVLEYADPSDPSVFIKKDYSQEGILLIQESFSDYALDGTTYHFFESGDTLQAIDYTNGRVNGKVRVWFKSGEQKSLAYYHRDTLVEMNRYYKNGQRESDVPIVKGELHGMASYYDTLGNVILIGEWINNKREGEWKHYDEKGELTAIETYQNNKVVSTKEM